MLSVEDRMAREMENPSTFQLREQTAFGRLRTRQNARMSEERCKRGNLAVRSGQRSQVGEQRLVERRTADKQSRVTAAKAAGPRRMGRCPSRHPARSVLDEVAARCRILQRRERETVQYFVGNNEQIDIAR